MTKIALLEVRIFIHKTETEQSPEVNSDEIEMG